MQEVEDEEYTRSVEVKKELNSSCNNKNNNENI